MTAQNIVKALNGSWYGSYGVCSCPTLNHHRGDRRPSLKVSDGEREPLVHCFAGCDWQDVKAALRRQGLLDDFRNAKQERFDQSSFERLQRQAAERDRRRSVAACNVWGKCIPSLPGGLADAYLKSRGLWLPEIDAIREAPSLKYTPSNQYHPAMVCRVDIPGSTGFGLHRTYLAPGGRGKAKFGGNKAMLGICSGGAVRLFPAAEKIAIAEGIETALAVRKLSGLPVWAALSTSGLISLVLPNDVREIVIAADHDVNGAGERAANRAAKRWCAEGRKVDITMPTRPGSDWLDVLGEAA
ncbi:MAG: toprim domain-containing protein [Rhodospirillales bacterium]